MIAARDPIVSERPKILIVDDRPSNLVVLKRLLSRVDADVLAAVSGNEALQMTLNHDFALVLLDVQMPDIDGYEVAQLMRGEDRTREVPIIFLTAAHRDCDHRRRGYGAGAVDYIEKPIDEIVLLSKVRVFIELYRSHAELKRLFALLTRANGTLQVEIEARRRSEEEGRRLAGTIFDAMTEGIMVCDAETRIIAVNPAFSRITGYGPAEIIGRNPRVMGSGRQDHAVFIEMWAALDRDGRWEGELWNRRKTGEVYPVWMSVSVIRRDDGGVDRYVGIFSDITRRKQTEHELMESREAAERANQAKSHFLTNVGHEFRTPLNAILGFSELLLIEGETLISRHRDYAASIHGSGQNLLELVNDLLDLSKIESGQWSLTPGLFAVGPLVDDCVRLLQADAAAAGISLSVDLAAAPPALLADQRAIRQCVLNLLSNAIKFTAAGGRVTASVLTEGGKILIRVTDTGIGITPEDIPRLMHPFEQAEAYRDRPCKGTGLGLAVARSLTELHGGHMSIESVPGEGATVTLALPSAGPELPSATAPRPA